MKLICRWILLAISIVIGLIVFENVIEVLSDLLSKNPVASFVCAAVIIVAIVVHIVRDTLYK